MGKEGKLGCTGKALPHGNQVEKSWHKNAAVTGDEPKAAGICFSAIDFFFE